MNLTHLWRRYASRGSQRHWPYLAALVLLIYLAGATSWGAALLTLATLGGISWLTWRYRKKLPAYRFAGRHWTLPELMNLSPAEFERFVAHVYRALGYQVRDNPYRAADGGIDLLLERAGQQVVVQCKRWQGAVAVQPVRELWGVKHALAADGAVFVTTGRFTAAASMWANDLPGLELIDGSRLLRAVEQLATTKTPAADV